MDQNIIKITSADLRNIISEEATKFRRKRMLTEQREKIIKALNECDCEHEVNECNDGMQQEGMLDNISNSIEQAKFFTKENNGAYEVLSFDKSINEPVTRIYPKHNSDQVSMWIPPVFGYGKTMDFDSVDDAVKFLSALQNAKDKHDSDKFNTKYSLKH